ncbi:MAG TPA: hypothetical protein VHG72_18445 [Polyangia bacterium]|nr:hypothetical protein [Polyangia bacterium]
MPSKRLKLTQEQVAAAKETLDAIPPAPKELRPVTMSEAIRTLTPTIRRLLERGHSREAVLGFLKEQGIECSPSTFKESYRPGRGKTSAKPPSDGEGAASSSPSAQAADATATTAPPNATTPTAAGSATAPPVARTPPAKTGAESRPDQRPTSGLHPAVAKAS